MKPSEILRKAADYHAEHGHCKGNYRDAEGRVCAMGAIYGAAGVEWYEDGGGFTPVIGYGNTKVADAAVSYAHEAAFDSTGHRFVHAYNDQPDTSPEDITLLLKRAAEIAEKDGD